MGSIVYIIISAFFLISGIAVLLSGVATEKKSLRLAGIVIAVISFQYIVVAGIYILLERL